MALPFDPQATDVLGYDQHLPAVDATSLSAQALRQRFLHPPEWVPDVEVERWFSTPNPRPAAVLIPLVMRPQPTVLLTQRAVHLKAHGGQISFPGGRHDAADLDLVNTALREAHEEVGLHPERVEVLGSLPTYTTNSGFVVTPVVGLLQPWDLDDEQLKLERQPGEVDDIFEVPLEFLMNPANHQRRMLIVGGAQVEFLAMPWSSTLAEEPYFIWGATAAMLRNLYRFLAA